MTPNLSGILKTLMHDVSKRYLLAVICIFISGPDQGNVFFCCVHPDKNWNYDEPGEGCIDTDNDCICDSSYSISGGSGID